MAAPRRSARIRMADEQNSAPAPPLASLPRVNTPAARAKAKAKANATTSTAGRSKAAKATMSTAGRGSTAKAPAAAGSSQGKCRFSSLPPELMAMVLGNIEAPSTMSALARTNWCFYALVMPRLYARISVGAMYHAKIPKLIRTIEPLLTISQKKQLKREGKYGGQQERYSTALDTKAVPLSAGFVQQLVLDGVDPGRKHQYICIRYIEELLKNLPNVEILQTVVMNESIAESIGSMKHLQALSMGLNVSHDIEVASLSRVGNLKHLDARNWGFSAGFQFRDAVRSILRNSASTLRSLNLSEPLYGISCFEDTDCHGKARGEKFELKSLKALGIGGINNEAAMVSSLMSTVNFLNLQELRIGDLNGHSTEDSLPLYSQLISLFGGASSRGIPPALRKLTLHLEHHGQDALLPSRLLYSLDSLTSLAFHGQSYEATAQPNIPPAISNMLLRAILNQKNLRILRFTYRGLLSNHPFPYMPSAIVGTLLKGLPNLREFEFAPMWSEIEEISRVLARHGRNLTTIYVFNLQEYPNATPSGTTVLDKILHAFLQQAAAKDPKGRAGIVWEHEVRLRRIFVNHTVFDIASKFGKRGKGTMCPGEVAYTDSQAVKHRVLYREDTRPDYINFSSDPAFSWLEDVRKDLS